MMHFSNVMEVFMLLDKSNCRRCNEKTCMAFAAAVYKGKKHLSECPLVTDEVAGRYGVRKNQLDLYEEDGEKTIRTIKQQLAKINFKTVAETIGGTFDGRKMTLQIMGKKFCVDTDGNIYTDIHVNSWVLVSAFNYITRCQGVPVAGNWVSFRELPGGRDRYGLFEQQCEKPLKRLADNYPELLADMAELFSSRLSDQYQSDIAVVLLPMPLVPMLICYWKTEEGMDSSLSLFFDVSAEKNIGIDGLYLLGTGITKMFEKFALKHG